jgi:hypothetical protein
MNKQEAENILYYAAASRAVGLGFRLGQGAEIDMRDAARKAAGEILAPGRQQDAIDADLERAVRNVQTWIDTMISVRRLVYADNPQMLASNIIGEDTWKRVKALLCPGFFPVC